MKGPYLLRDLPFFLDHQFHSAIDRSKIWRNRYLLHGFSWAAVYFFWILVFQKTSFALSRTATIQFCYLMFIAGNFYFNIYYTVPNFLYRRKYIQFALLFISGIATAALLRVPLASLLNAHYFLVGQVQPAAGAILVASLINVFIWTSIIISAKLIYDHFRFEESMVQLKEEKSNVELDLLNAQMNPHFLFNSLNTIYGEINHQNSIARNLILSFSNMLRYQLYDCNHQRVLISNELSYITNYVNLQRARMEEDVEVFLNIDDQLGNFPIAPLLFVCFIENAFKYAGRSELYGNRIEISLSKSRGNLSFCCFNTKDETHSTNHAGGGVGLNNAKKRLALHYPGKNDLHIINSGQYFLVELTIEINELEMHDRG